MARKIAAGNWKMNGTRAALAEVEALVNAHPAPRVGVILCPPATLICAMKAIAGPIAVGGQDCHAEPSGAHTGDISAQQLCDAGASYVILGHSERRADHAETDPQVEAKAQAAWAAGLQAVICIGETETERDAGTTLAVIGEQLSASVPEGATGANTIIAYEPVWAIGTGRTPTLAQIAEVHDFLRAELAERFGADQATEFSLLYGGSVKPSNAAEIFQVANVDGALVGGASLKAADFGPIIAALESI
ncbi:triose-phosphate isomerase [Albirhodobacter sp. R86504]|uniref:triose-phosphate isomerase n=1 Tax=Albirhodobacter sp. R86504 TaxID=3093848 RepID=UPI00366A8844